MQARTLVWLAATLAATGCAALTPAGTSPAPVPVAAAAAAPDAAEPDRFLDIFGGQSAQPDPLLTGDFLSLNTAPDAKIAKLTVANFTGPKPILKNDVKFLLPRVFAAMSDDVQAYFARTYTTSFLPDRIKAFRPIPSKSFDFAAFFDVQAQALTPVQIAAQDGHKMVKFPVALVPHVALLKHLTDEGFNGLTTDHMRAFTPPQLADLTLDRISKLKLDQAEGLTRGQVLSLRPEYRQAYFNQLDKVYKAQVPLPAPLTAAQVHALPPAELVALSHSKIRSIPPTEIQKIRLDVISMLVEGLQRSQVEQLSENQIRAISPNYFRFFQQHAFGGIVKYARLLNQAQLVNTPPLNFKYLPIFGVLTGQQFTWLSPVVIENSDPEFIKALPPVAFSGMAPNVFAAMTTEGLKRLTKPQFGAIPLIYMQKLTKVQAAAFSAAQLEMMSQQQRGAINVVKFGL